MKVTNITVSDIKYDLSAFKKYEDRLKPLLPTRKREIVSFVLRNTDTPTANGLRRTLIEELPVKILTSTVEDIETDEEFLIRDELLDRIHSTPVDQNLKNDAVFKIDVLNNDTAKRIGHVYSASIVPSSGSSRDFAGKLCDTRFRIAELHPGKHLRVNNITVIEGYGYMHANFMLTCGIRYKPLDFTDVWYVNPRGFIERGMTRTADVLAATKGFNDITIHDERVLYIPNKSCEDHMSEAGKGRISNFSTIIKKDVKFYSSSTSHPTEYLLEVETTGTVPGRQLIKKACLNIVERLKGISKSLEVYLKDPDAVPDGDVIANITPTVTKVELKGETHTIAEILVYNVQKLDPMVANIGKHIIHPMNRTVVINISHSEPIRILMDACKLGVTNYEKISSAF
jgi:DNA-directed RNA polymerase subunit L